MEEEYRNELKKQDLAEQRERQVSLHLRIDTYGDAAHAKATAEKAIKELRVKGFRITHYRTEGNR